jgi:hypothetical protein
MMRAPRTPPPGPARSLWGRRTISQRLTERWRRDAAAPRVSFGHDVGLTRRKRERRIADSLHEGARDPCGIERQGSLPL